jgi:hypothetical protein
MARSVLPVAVVAGLSAMLAGCGMFDRPQRPAWRDAAEKSCLARKAVKASVYVQPARPLDGPGICGVYSPLKVSALAAGRVAIAAPATLGCSVTEALENWVEAVVQPAAQSRFGQPVAQIDSMGSYNCRGMNNQRGAKLSEHAFGNALDIGGFTLADGRKITVVKHWTKGDQQEQAFLRETHAGACEHFTTVLGPGSNVFHYNHLHVDLAMHGATSTGPRRYCRPIIKDLAPPPRRDDLPDAPWIEPELEIARANPVARRAVALSREPQDFIARPAAAVPMQGVSGGSVQRYGRLSGLEAQAPFQAYPVARAPMPAARGGMLRDDGAFVPPEDIGD